MIFLDTNVIVDLVTRDGEWFEWSSRTVTDAFRFGPLAISQIVLAELHARAAVARQYEVLRARLGIAVVPLSDAAAIRGGQAHGVYRERAGPREAILADFLIGGLCSVLGASLITRDRQRFASYFPELTLISPEGA